jgi:hypothetical protein
LNVPSPPGKRSWAKKARTAAIFAGHIEAEPRIELIADAKAEQRRVLDVLVEELEVVELHFLEPNMPTFGLAAPIKPFR